MGNKGLKYIVFLSVLLWHISSFSQEKSQATIDYIEKYCKIAMLEMQEYKIPASITLAQGILESGSGNGELAKKSNNHFGIKCHNSWDGKRTYHDDDEKGECFRVYDSPAESYRDHSIFLSSGQRYAFLFDLKITDYKGWAKGLKKAGYATLPVYANVLIKLIETYDLTKYDQQALKGPKIVIKKDKRKNNNNSKDKQRVASTEVYVPYKLTDAEIVDKLYDGRYVRENNGVKFIYAKEGDDVYVLSDKMEIYDYQLVKYNNLGKRRSFKEGEIVYLEQKKRKASRKYKYHTIQKGETLSYVSRLYAVKLESIFKMNDMDENTVLHVGDNIRLR